VPDLNFSVLGAEPVRHAAAPLLAIKLQITNAAPDETIQSVMLSCQVQIDAVRRHYSGQEPERLRDLFGERALWGRSLRSLLWTITSVVVPAFTGTTVVDLPLPCSFDFNVQATKYFYALADGQVPLNLLFAGTIYYLNAQDQLQVAPVPWDCEASFALPVAAWQALMAEYYPNGVWLRLEQAVFDRLYQFKQQQALPTWERVFERLLPAETPQERYEPQPGR
jgi:hypothetical protein